MGDGCGAGKTEPDAVEAEPLLELPENGEIGQTIGQR